MERELADHLAVEVDLEKVCAGLGEDNLVDVGLDIGCLCLIVEREIHLRRLAHYHRPGRVENFDLLDMEAVALGPGGENAELRVCHRKLGREEI